MKHLNGSYLILIIVVVLLSSCVTNISPATPISIRTQLASPTFIQPTALPILAPIETATLIPPSTLEPEKARETIRMLLQGTVDCLAPCFWGITPEQTTVGEAKNILTHLGLQIKNTTFHGKDFYGISYDFDSGMSIIVTLTVQNEIVTDLRVDIDPKTQKPGVAREWLAYSPETLIEEHGTPSSVDFSGFPGPQTYYFMTMHFDAIDLIVEYDYGKIGHSFHACPLSDEFETVHLWFGTDPQYPPPLATPLEQATTMTMDDFVKLMAGNPDKACFTLSKEIFK